MDKDKCKSCCKGKSYKEHCHCEKKCHHENHHCDQLCERSCMCKRCRKFRRCCKCGCFCNMILFQKSKRGCRFVFECKCGHCFECICDFKGNCCCERECCRLDKKNTIKFNVNFVNESCHKKKTCSHNCLNKKKRCKCK